MLSRTSAQFSVVHNYLEALQHICYQVLDFSHFKIEALRAGDVPVPQVSEYWANYNHMDVVKSTSLIPESWLFIVVTVIMISFFVTTLDLSAIIDQATERHGYDWEYCTRNLVQHTTEEERQFCIRITSRANGRSVGYIYGRPCHRSFEAIESAIIRALAFIDSCSYRIRDINYYAWMQMYSIVHSPSH
jgi:hypothetical protein